MNNEPKLFSKLILYSNEDFEILSIFSENNTNKFELIKEIVASDNFWKNSIKNLDDNYVFFSYKFNKYENDEIKPKNYLSIKQIADESDY